MDVLRKIFGHKKEDVAGDLRNVRNEGLLELYCYPDIITYIRVRRMRWIGHVRRVAEKTSTFRDLVRQREGN